MHASIYTCCYLLLLSGGMEDRLCISLLSSLLPLLLLHHTKFIKKIKTKNDATCYSCMDFNEFTRGLEVFLCSPCHIFCLFYGFLLLLGSLEDHAVPLRPCSLWSLLLLLLILCFSLTTFVWPERWFSVMFSEILQSLQITSDI
jgi:hypothetical protein